MNVKDGIIKPLREHGIDLYDESDFIKCDDRESVSRGAALMYFARCANGPDAGLPVTIKMLSCSMRDYVLASEREDQNLVCEETWRDFERECCILKSIKDHPNIQKFIGVVKEFQGSDRPGLVCKDVAVGDLQTFVFKDKRATVMTKLKLMQDVAKTLAFLHERKIEHHNVKARNILVDVRDGNLVALLGNFLCARDFSNSTHIEDSEPSATLQYIAPEFFYKIDRLNNFNKGMGDMWSFGCTLIEVLASTRYVWSLNDDELIMDELNRKNKPVRPATFPPWDEAWAFIQERCLSYVPSERITASEAVGELGRLLETVPKF